MFIKKWFKSFLEWWIRLIMKLNPDKQREYLWLALSEGYLSVLRFYVQNGGCLNIRHDSGMTPLHVAVVNDQTEIVNFLINHLDDLNLLDGTGQTALFLAVMRGNLEICRLLIENGANVNALNSNGQTPVRAALPKWANKLDSHDSILALLVENGAKLHMIRINDETVHPLHLATMLRFNTGVSAMLQRGVDANIKDYDNTTALYWAVRAKNMGAATLLLHCNADVNSINTKRRRTPLHKAAEEGDRPFVELLLSAGADPTITDYKGRSPREAASLRKHQLEQRNRDPNYGFSAEDEQKIADLEKIIERLSPETV